MDDTPVYNLKAVVLETGLKPDTLRAWERRYGVLSPGRSEGGYRLYSERDINLFGYAAGTISIAIDRARVEEERRAAGDPLEASGPARGGYGLRQASQVHGQAGPLRLLEMVRREHDRGAARDLGVDDRQDLLLAGQVEPGDRFVEEQELRRADQGLRDQHSLALPT